VSLAGPEACDLVPHLRPATAERLGAEGPPGAAILDLDDPVALREALSGCSTVIQLIGTMRKRFARGDTYASSDIGTTRSLVEASRDSGVDHIVLLSSVGAGSPRGAYLKAKATAESLVRDSGLSWTIFRPSAFIGGGHSLPWGTAPVLRSLAPQRYRPIDIEDLARTILWVAREREGVDSVLEGASLWDAVEASRSIR
jgi:uncharacterized protein YbjT (DUF2867 family)